MMRATRVDKDEQHINVYVRIRPFNQHELESHNTSVLDIVHSKEIHLKQTYHNKRYCYDYVFGATSTQHEVYDRVARPLIQEVISGYNCTVFAYGQTGTGKTHTISGSENQLEAGIIPRAITQIFQTLNSAQIENTVKVSYIELYNEELFDLLSQSSEAKYIKMYEDKGRKGSVILQGLEEVLVNYDRDVQRILDVGSEKRKTAPTLMNASSSRSHTVFIVTIHTRETTPEGEELVKCGKLNLVDLAGSENIGRSGSVDIRAREAGNINQSLLTLGRVIKALTDKNSHIPYRESKLTRILQDSLGGRTKTSLIATVSDAHSNLEETVSTLEYAMRARSIRNRPEINKKLSRTSLIKQYTEDIARLKKDLLACRTGTGVYLNEENYNEMLAENQARRDELVDKMTCIRNLEVEIQDYTLKLADLESSWTNTVSEVGSLSSQKAVLEQDLRLAKQKTVEQEQQIEAYKVDTKKLITEVKQRAEVGSTLQEKVTYLYKASYHNIEASKEFHELYTKISKDLLKKIDDCIHFTYNIITRQTDEVCNVKCMFEEFHGSLKTCLEELCLIYNKLYMQKAKCVEEHQALEGKLHKYGSCLTKFVRKNSSDLNTLLLKIKNEQLNKLKTSIQAIKVEQENDYKDILNTLIMIRVSAGTGAAELSALFYNKRMNIIAEIDKLKDSVVEHNATSTNNYNYVQNLKEEIKSDFGNVANTLIKLQQKYDEKLGLVETSYIGSINDINGTREEIENLKTTVCTIFKSLAESVVRETTNTVDSVMIPMNDTKQYAKKHMDNVTKTSEELQSVIDCIEARRTQYEDSYTEFKDTLCKSSAKMSEQMKQYKKYFETMEHYWQHINDTCDSSKDRNNRMKEFVDKQLTSVEEQSRSVSTGLADTQNKYSKEVVSLNMLVNKFCNVELQHPKHVGDTPKSKKFSKKELPSTSKVLDSRSSLPPTSSITSISANIDSESSSSESVTSNFAKTYRETPDAREVRPRAGDGDIVKRGEGSSSSSEYETTLDFPEEIRYRQ